MKSSDIPLFGTLKGVRILSVGTNIAGPVAATLFAEQGADVVQVESTLSPDMLRVIGNSWAVEHRNNRTIALNIRTPQGEAILKKLIASSDAVIESSKGGTWKKWGLTDEALWEINPKLVIAHVSGYGQEGDPSYVPRASFDTIGQAFSGFMAVNGMPDPEPPLPVRPYTCDYVTALFTAWAVAAALLNAEKTGAGESIDVAQYEVMARIQGDALIGGLNGGPQPERTGVYGNTQTAIANVARCGDGNYVSLGIGGAGVCSRLEKLLGLEGDPDFAEPHASFRKADGIRSEKMVAALGKFCMSQSAHEVNRVLNEIQVPCSVVMTYDMMLENEQYQARNTIISWHDPVHGEDVKGVTAVPVFKKNPGQVYRGGPLYGMDTDDILEEIGFDEDGIAAVRAEGTVR